MPECREMPYGAFTRCSSLSKIYAPQCISIGQYAFTGCSLLTTVSFPKCLSLHYMGVFTGCFNLSKIYLLGPCPLNWLTQSINWINTFDNSPITQSSYLGYFGSIYVRASLLSFYQHDKYWSKYSSHFVGVENIYSTSASITNGECNFDYDEVAEDTSIQAHIIPSAGYSFPTSILVTGADYVYDSVTGNITLSNPNSEIIVSAICE